MCIVYSVWGLRGRFATESKMRKFMCVKSVYLHHFQLQWWAPHWRFVVARWLLGIAIDKSLSKHNENNDLSVSNSKIKNSSYFTLCSDVYFSVAVVFYAWYVCGECFVELNQFFFYPTVHRHGKLQTFISALSWSTYILTARSFFGSNVVELRSEMNAFQIHCQWELSMIEKSTASA